MKKPDKLMNTNPVIEDHLVKQNRHFPNSKLPVLIYRNAFFFGKQKFKAAQSLQTTLNKNEWKNTWSNGIYTFHHYHSNTHECMGIAAGRAWVIVGGPGGKRLQVEKGDVIILPAGVAHKCSKASLDFLCVGAYPGGKQYDTNLGTKAEFEKSKSRLAKLPVPALDPVFGDEGFLKTFWKRSAVK